MADDNGYGYDHPVLNALAAWDAATDPYRIPEDITDEVRLELNRTARVLNGAIIDLVPYSYVTHPGDGRWEEYNKLWEKAYRIRVNIRGLTGQFLLEDYTDSNTDEPCDMEWDVVNLVAEADKGYDLDTMLPEHIRPAYVGGGVYPGPKEDQE